MRIYNKIVLSSREQDLKQLSKLLIKCNTMGEFRILYNEEEIENSGWFLTGLTHNKGLSDANLLWFSYDPMQAYYYGGHGTILFSKPKDSALILDIRGYKEREDFIIAIQKEVNMGTDGISYAVEDHTQYQALDELVNPENIVEEGGIWEDVGFVNAVYYIWGIDVVKTHNGGIVLNTNEIKSYSFQEIMEYKGG